MLIEIISNMATAITVMLKSLIIGNMTTAITVILKSLIISMKFSSNSLFYFINMRFITILIIFYGSTY